MRGAAPQRRRRLFLGALATLLVALFVADGAWADESVLDVPNTVAGEVLPRSTWGGERNKRVEYDKKFGWDLYEYTDGKNYPELLGRLPRGTQSSYHRDGNRWVIRLSSIAGELGHFEYALKSRNDGTVSPLFHLTIDSDDNAGYYRSLVVGTGLADKETKFDPQFTNHHATLAGDRRESPEMYINKDGTISPDYVKIPATKAGRYSWGHEAKDANQFRHLGIVNYLIVDPDFNKSALLFQTNTGADLLRVGFTSENRLVVNREARTVPSSPGNGPAGDEYLQLELYEPASPQPSRSTLIRRGESFRFDETNLWSYKEGDEIVARRFTNDSRLMRYENGQSVKGPTGPLQRFKIINNKLELMVGITSAAPSTGQVAEPYSHYFTESYGEGATWKIKSGELPQGLELIKSSGHLRGTPLTAGDFTFTVAVQTPWAEAAKEYSIHIAASIYGDRIEFRGLFGHDSLMVALDGKGTLRGFADDVNEINIFYINKEYVGLELRDPKMGDRILKSASVRGEEAPAEIVGDMRWQYQDGNVLEVRHAEARDNLTAYSGGKAFPQDAASPQRFVIENNRFSRDVAAITSAAPAKARVGEAYRHQLAGTGSGAHKWSINKGSLPAGLTLDENTGLISGTPKVVGSSAVTVRLQTFAGSGMADYVVLVDRGAPTITSAVPPAGKAREAYTHQFTTDDVEGASWKVESGAPPVGIALDAKTGRLSGMPTRVGKSNFVVSVTTTWGKTEVPYTLEITPGSPLSEIFDTRVQFNGLDDRDVLTVALDGKGNVVGFAENDVPAHEYFQGQEYLGVELRDGNDRVLQSASVNGDQSASAIAEAMAWKYQDGNFLVVRHAEAKSRLTAYSGGNALPLVDAKTQRFLIAHNTLVRDTVAITSAAPAQAKVGNAYKHQLTGTGSGSHAWSVTNGALPSGMTLDAKTGAIAGTPTTAGSVTFTVQLQNFAGTATAEYTLVVQAKAPTITSKAPPAGKAREAYTHQFTASDGEGAVWAVASGSLPVGVTLDAKSGVLSGVPLRVGSSTFELSVTTPGGVAKASNTVVVAAGAPVSAKYGDRVQFDGVDNHDVWTVVLDGGKVRGFAENDVASHPIFASNPYYVAVELRDNANTLLQTGIVKGDESASAVAEAMNWSYSDGDVLVAWHQEAGARLTVFSGGKALPQDEAKTQRFLIQNNTLVRDVASITSAAPAPAKVGEAYRHQLTGTGMGAAEWLVSKGVLPQGLALDGKTGLISGTPTKAGSVTFTVQLQNLAGTATREETLVVYPKAPTITSKAPPAGKTREAYTHRFAATDDEGATWKIESGTVPVGLTLEVKTGLLSGSPTRVSTSTFEVSVTTLGGVAKATYEIAVAAGAPVSTTFGERIQFDGADDHDVWTVVLDGKGKVRSFAENDVPSNAAFADKSYYVSVELRDKANVLLQNAVIKGNESASAVAEAMDWPYYDDYALLVRHQEAGKRLTAFSGDEALPRAAETTQRFVIRDHSLTRVQLSIESEPPPPALVGKPYTHRLTGSATGKALWSVPVGTLPDGLTLEPETGVITGSATTMGRTTFTVQLTQLGLTATAEYTMLVAAGTPPVIETPEFPVAKLGNDYTYQFRASDDFAGKWSVAFTRDPYPGLTIDPDTGVLSGIPTSVGYWTIVVSIRTPAGLDSRTSAFTVVSNVQDTYPNAVQFTGANLHDVLWVGVDAQKQELVGVATDTQIANTTYSKEPYVEVELRDENDVLVQSASVRGDENAVDIAASLHWKYRDGWTLVARHQLADLVDYFISHYSDGEKQPGRVAKTQRFRLVGDHLVREAVVTIASPRDGARIVEQPTISGTAVAGTTVRLATEKETVAIPLGSVVADQEGRWEFIVPSEKALPLGDLVITAVMADQPGSMRPRVAVTVVEIPAATLTMKAWTQVVKALTRTESPSWSRREASTVTGHP